jgi:beta-lactamase class C
MWGLIAFAIVFTAFGLIALRPPAAARQSSSAMLIPDPQSAQELSPSRVDYRRLDERLTRVMQGEDQVGLAVGTIERGQIRFVKGYGEVLAGSGVRVTPDTVFRWASLSKGVASTVVVKLAEQGRLSLAAPLMTLGTTLRLSNASAQVTVADLLSHRLGLSRNAWDDRLEAGEDPRVLRSSLGTLPLLCPPGTCYSYQNVAYDTASEIVEHATGRPYADVVRDALFGPLGMTHASIGRAALEGSRDWARPHHFRRTPATVNDDYYRVPAAGGVNSSIKDLLLWMRAQMGDAPDVLSAEALRTLHDPRVPTPPHGRRGPMDRALTNAAYGLGWRSFSYAGHTLVGHRGSVDGYGSLILFDPADKSGIVMLWNSNRAAPARAQLEFFDMLYGRPAVDWLEIDRAKALDAAREQR